MATEDVEVELQEVRINIPAADPGASGRTTDDDNTVGGSDMPAVDPSGRTQNTPLDVAVARLVDQGVDIRDQVDIVRNITRYGSLHMATYFCDLSGVRSFHLIGADLNEKDDEGNTPLHVAAKDEFVDVVKYLVDHGADVNIRNHFGSTPLHVAAKKHYKEIEKYLVDHGADVNMKDGVDVLEDLKKAMQDGDVESFKQQLAEVEEFYRDNTMRALADSGALCSAAGAGSIPMMDILIQKGAGVNTKSSVETDGGWETTPLHEAAGSGNVEKVIYLCDKGADANIKDERRRTPLQRAASKGYDVVRYLVDKGADVNNKDSFGMTPLHEAASSGNVDIVRYLSDKGADVNIKNEKRLTPLHWAATRGYVDVVRCLVDKGADVNIKDSFGRTPVHYAAIRGNVDIVRYLFDKGADVNIKDDEGETPLHRACGGGYAECVKYLLEKGADPTAKHSGGMNSLSWAIDSRHKDVATILLGHDKWKEMLRSSSKGTTIMRKLIAFMPDVAEVAFSKCVTTNDGEKDSWSNRVHATSNTFEVDYNYEFLEDFQDKHSADSGDESWRPKKFTKNHHPLNLIREHDCSNLLKHPLVISLLEHKWTRFGRYIFFGNLFIYLIFLAFLTAFGLVVLSPLEKTCVEVLNGSFNGTAPKDCEGLSIHEYRFLYVGAAVTILTALLRLATEIFQLCRHPLEYLLDWVNWLEIPLYLFSIIFTFIFTTPCLCVYTWQWQIGVVAVFLGWVGLITFLQKWPVTGVYVLMFVNILISFMKIAFLALLLVIAFALSFYMLLFEPDEMRTAFSHPGRAIVKVMAMTTGELDYDDLYHQQEGEDEIAFPPVSFLLWILFLVLMPVLLSNLLVGLAVGDVDRLQQTASENRIGLQIDLILSFEELLESLGIRHRFAIEQSKTHPNVPATLLPEWCKRGTTDDKLVEYPEDHKVRARMAKWYSKLWITDEYSTSGVKVSDAIKAPPESLEKHLQKQHQQLEAKLSEQLEAKLNEHGEKLSEQFQEAVGQFSECHKEQTKKSEEQMKKSEEQMKKSEELAVEVATLRETLEKLVAQMAAK